MAVSRFPVVPVRRTSNTRRATRNANGQWLRAWVGAAPRRVRRSGPHGDEWVGLVDPRRDAMRRIDEPGPHGPLQPIACLADLLQGGPHLVDEVGGALGASGLLVVRSCRGPQRSHCSTRLVAPGCLVSDGRCLTTPAARSRRRTAMSSPLQRVGVPCRAFALPRSWSPGTRQVCRTRLGCPMRQPSSRCRSRSW